MSSKHSLPHFVCTVLIHTRHFIFHRKTDEYRRKCVICVCVFMLFRGILVHSNNNLIPLNILRGRFQMSLILLMSSSFVGQPASSLTIIVGLSKMMNLANFAVRRVFYYSMSFMKDHRVRLKKYITKITKSY